MDLPFDSSETDRKAVNPYDNYEQLNVMATPANVPGKVTSTDNRKAPQNNPSSNGPVFTGILLLVQLLMLISAWSASLLALSPSIFLEIGSKDYPLLSATSLVGLALLMQMTLIGNVCLFTAHNCFLAFFSFGLIVSGAAGGLFVYLSCIVEASDPQLLLFVACGAVGCSLVIWVIQLLKVILCWPEAKQLENP